MLALSTHDQLTGIYNRRALEDALSKVAKHQVNRDQRSFSILLMDVDKFKSINDTYGHEAGDQALKTMALQTGKIIRSHDIFGRYGGEEFLLILPETDIDNATALAERIRAGIESTPVILPDSEEKLNITVSIGCISSGPPPAKIDLMLRAADKAMYAAKHSGRNRVISVPIIKQENRHEW